MDRLQVTLPGVASSVPPARHFVQRTLEAWQLDDVAWTAALVVSELAANAALHAGTEFTVIVEREGDAVRISVHDGSVRVPRQRRHSTESTTGRGLRLVDDLATQWGVERQAAGGKTVWALLPVAVVRDGAQDDDDVDDVDALLAAFSDEPDEPAGTTTLRLAPGLAGPTTLRLAA